MSTQHRHGRINDQNFTGFCILFAIFTGGLVLNFVVAAKVVDLFGFILPASVFTWALMFPMTDIAAEVYGRQYANKIVLGGLVCYIMVFTVFQITLALPAAEFWQGAEAFEFVIGSSKRIMLASICSYAVCQFADVYIFSWVRQKTNARYLWLRNNVSTMTSQTLTNIIFLTIAFWGTMEPEQWWLLFKSNLIFRFALAFVDTPVVYAGTYLIYKFHPELREQGP